MLSEGCRLERIDYPDMRICKVLGLYMAPRMHFNRTLSVTFW